MIDFTKVGSELKDTLLEHLRERAAESYEEVKQTYGISQYKQRAGAINKEVAKTAELLHSNLEQTAKHQGWDNKDLLDRILMLNYAHYVVMLESRNEAWPYEYMAFSRRIGEIWEPFCILCFQYPVTEIEFFIPPLFSEVKRGLKQEVTDYIDNLNITADQKQELKEYYNKVWTLVSSGEIKLELDLHFIDVNGTKVNVDFKSGFGSNEKGNTNRLLMVATVYEYVTMSKYHNLLLVRSAEDNNNNYFQVLKKSDVWEAHCGDAAYERIEDYTGFGLKDWISRNVNWLDDFSDDMRDHLLSNDLDKYLTW